jgi:diphthine synthase
MPLYLIGLGLGDEKDVTVKGAEAIARCSLVFLEAYTSVLGVDARKLVSQSSVAVCNRERGAARARTNTRFAMP